jgi:hypothetical protein
VTYNPPVFESSDLLLLFSACGSTPTVEEMLGNQGVTESNMMQYLGIIEQRTIEILHTYAQSQVPHPHMCI